MKETAMTDPDLYTIAIEDSLVREVSALINDRCFTKNHFLTRGQVASIADRCGSRATRQALRESGFSPDGFSGFTKGHALFVQPVKIDPDLFEAARNELDPEGRLDAVIGAS